MDRLKLLSMLCLISMFVPATVLAQPDAPADRPRAGEGPGGPGGQGGPGGRGGMMADRFRQTLHELDLTEQQRKEIDRILDEARQEMRDSMPEMRDMAPEDRQQHMREHFTKVREQVMAQLTEEQKAKLQERRQQIGRGEMEPGIGPPPPPPPGAPAGPDADAAPLRRLREAVEKLELTDEQREQIRETLAEAGETLRELREKAMAEAEQVRSQAMKIIEETRTQVQQALTPEQRERLREMVEQIRPPFGREGGERRGPPDGPERRFRGEGVGEGEMQGDRPRPPREGRGEGVRPPRPQREGGDVRPPRPPRPDGAGERTGPPSPPEQRVAAPASDSGGGSGAAIGDTAPDFTLERLNGRPLALSSLKGRVVVVTFGSYSSPAFRQRAAQLEELRRVYGPRATFLIVYTKEAHPKGEREIARNRQDGVAIEQHADLPARRAAATTARDKLALKGDILLDTMDDATMTAYDAGANSAFVIARDGKIVARQQWCDPSGLRHWIDQAIATPAPQGTSTDA